MLVRLVKDWVSLDLMRQTPQGDGRWRDIQFTLDPVTHCDYVIVLNNQRDEDITVHCPPEHVWSIMQEPYIPFLRDWMIKDLDWCSRILSHHADGLSKVELSHPVLPWYVDRNYSQLLSCKQPVKKNMVSWITSRLTLTPMHRQRMVFYKYLRSRKFPIHIYGKGIRHIPDKWDGLAPYYYSLAIENDRQNDYWSEKLADCFLSWTVPIYDGCLNLEQYFPAESFIRININDPAASVKTIAEIASPDDWQRRLPALQEARELVLQRWQFFPYLYEKIKNDVQPVSPALTIAIPANRVMRMADRRRFIMNELRRKGPLVLGRLLKNQINYFRWARL
jgi:hypothetical protein